MVSTHSIKLISALTLSIVALSFFIIAPKAHAEVSQEDLGQLQAQVDVIKDVVQKLKSIHGEVLGASTSYSGGFGDQRWGAPNFMGYRGQKAALTAQIAAFNKSIAEFTKKRDEAQAKLDKIIADEGSAASSTRKTFALVDVKSVTVKLVDPKSEVADDEYSLYTITLNSDRVVKVKACGFCTQEGRYKQFKDAGYTGDVAALIKLATKDSANADLSFTVKAVDATNKAEVTFSRPTACTPYSIAWGDGKVDKVTAMQLTVVCTQSIQEIKKTHTYEKAGTYTVTLTLNGKKGTKQVTVPMVATVSTNTAVYSQSSYSH